MVRQILAELVLTAAFIGIAGSLSFLALCLHRRVRYQVRAARLRRVLREVPTVARVSRGWLNEQAGRREQ